MKKLVIALFAVCVPACGLAVTGVGSWKVVQRYPLGGAGGWDYLTLDQSTQHLCVSRSDRVVVLNARNGRRVGEIDCLSGVHGIALADSLHRGFISNGCAGTVTAFDPATLKVEQTVQVDARNPDAIVYDPYSKRVFTFNGGSDNASVIDAVTGKLLDHVALPGRPEFSASDGQGHVFANIESKNELVEIDPVTMKVTAVWTLKDCEAPSGLAIDVAHHRLFSVCQNGIMAVTNAVDGKPVASVPIGEESDAARFDSRRNLVFSSNGHSGSLTIARQDGPHHYSVLANVPTRKSARTMALDEASGRVYLSSAELGPPPAPSRARPHPWSSVKPDSFAILVVGRTPSG